VTNVIETTVKFPRIRSFALRQPSSKETVLYHRQPLKELEDLVNELLYARVSRVTPPSPLYTQAGGQGKQSHCNDIIAQLLTTN